MSKSVNNVHIPSVNLDSKIIAALERVELASRASAWESSKNFGLNPLQVRLLNFLLQHEHRINTLSQLAREFNITKASMSETLSTMAKRGLLQKVVSKRDMRSTPLRLTNIGYKTALQLSSASQPITDALNQLTFEAKNQFFGNLNSFIFALHQNGSIPVQRMCLSCRYHRYANESHYCNLLRVSLADFELKIDCPEHLSCL